MSAVPAYRQILADLRRRESDPDYLASRAWFAAAFPDHPYGRPTRGDAASIAAWVLREGGAVLPQIDRVDLYETRGSGAIVSRADSEELIPV